MLKTSRETPKTIHHDGVDTGVWDLNGKEYQTNVRYALIRHGALYHGRRGTPSKRDCPGSTLEWDGWFIGDQWIGIGRSCAAHWIRITKNLTWEEFMGRV